jgi:NAD(P)-dependent dehydrogenase (short-subunit alcohol dehydrogenase family)
MKHHMLEGKVAVITGSGAGIGFAIARRFAAEGASIVLSGRNEARGQAAERALQGAGAKAIYVPLDVSREEQVRRLMESALAKFGTLDILINNAGPNGDDFGLGALHELSTEAFDRTMKIGAYGPFWDDRGRRRRDRKYLGHRRRARAAAVRRLCAVQIGTRGAESAGCE